MPSPFKLKIKWPDNKLDAPDLSQSEFTDLVKRANDGDQRACQELRDTLDANPQIWEKVGDLAAHAQMNMTKLIANGNTLISESITRKAEQMKRELTREGDSAIEKLAVERVVACWLETQYVDAMHPYAKGEYLPRVRFQLKLKESAQRRYLAAVKSMTTLQKLVAADSSGRPKLKLAGG